MVAVGDFSFSLSDWRLAYKVDLELTYLYDFHLRCKLLHISIQITVTYSYRSIPKTIMMGMMEAVLLVGCSVGTFSFAWGSASPRNPKKFKLWTMEYCTGWKSESQNCRELH